MRLLLGVTGGIAAYKAVELVRLATKAGHSVRVVQTPASLEFVGKRDVRGDHRRARARRPSGSATRPAAPTRATRSPSHAAISHLELVRRADVYAIAPASANTLAKLAGGHGRQPADERRAGLARAAARRAGDEQPHVGPPGHAGQPRDAAASAASRSCRRRAGRWPRRASRATGRLAEPAAILAAIEKLAGDGFAPRSLDGLRVLVTAGGTREPIDSVRFVGNRSSGRMGFALADECARRGATVTVVAANVVAAAQRRDRVRRRARPPPSSTRPAAPRSRDADVLLMAAAVADFRPGRRRRRQDQEGGPRRHVARARADDRRAGRAVRRAPPRPGAGRLRGRARRRRRAERARQARAQEPRRRRRQRHLAAGHRLRHARTTR